MKQRSTIKHIPDYQGQRWLQPKLPAQGESWLLGKQHSLAKETAKQAARLEVLGQLIEQAPWKWPKRPLYFICDLHADAEAFHASLVASGLIRKTGLRDKDYKLTKAARKGRILIGGDCFDKGPSVLRLLRSIHRLKKRGAKVSVLAGNHDIRAMIGMRAVDGNHDPRIEHFFVRMGPKAIPILKEIAEEYLNGSNRLRGIPKTRECRQRLFPSKKWFDEFPMRAEWMMPEAGINKELHRLKEKVQQFTQGCEDIGLSLRTAYAAALKFQEIFLHPKGEFTWFYRKLRLAHREGAFLFIHAGLNDHICRLITDHGICYLNRQFRRDAWNDPFAFYYGSLANTLRTKYRPVDMPFTPYGVDLMHRKGIHALVHGHRNLLHGQRIMLRKGMINFECDTSLDRNTRSKEGLTGHGASVTIFRPEGQVLGISNDYPNIKVFEPQALVKKRHKARKAAGKRHKSIRGNRTA